MSDKNQEYKKTEIGKLPSEWEIKSIGDIGEIITGSTPKITYDFIDKVQHLWVSPADMGNKKYIRDTVKKLNNSSFNKTRILPKGSILVTCIGSTIGKIGIAGDELSTNQQINSIVCSERYNNEYIYYVIDYNFNNYMRFISSQAVPIINKTTFSKFKIQIPRIEEQEKIAEILSTWDLAIEKQEQLIEMKKEFKKGLMQRLLSGEVRFKEFTDKWKPLMIKDIANSISELNKADEELIVLSCTKYDGLVESLKYFGKQMFSDDTSKYKKIWKNDFAYATNHIEEGSIGVQRICDVGLVSPMYTVFRVDDEIVDIDYLFYLLKTERYISIYKSRMCASVDRRGSLRWPEFSKIKLILPSIEEQKRITEVLKSADKEIELLEKELEALKLQKKDLMQRLLTGEVRVKV